jgi:hypothetical protein
VLPAVEWARVGVSGGRHYGLRLHVRHILGERLLHYGAIVVVEGANPNKDGADFFAGEWADDMRAAGLPVRHEQHPANWEAPCHPECHHGGRRRNRGQPGYYCPAQGNYRNQEMADSGLDEWLFFYEQGRARRRLGGTGDAEKRAIRAKIPLLRYEAGKFLGVDQHKLW